MLTTSTRKGLRGLFVFLVVALGLATVASAQRRAYIPTDTDGATVSAETVGLCLGNPLCGVDDPENVISETLNRPATLDIPINVLGAVRLRVNLPSDQSNRARAGFVLRDATGLLDLTALDRVTVRTYRDGEVRDEYSDAALIRVNDYGLDRYAFTVRTRQTFDALEIEVAGVVGLATEIQVLWAQITPPPDLTKIFARAPQASATGGTFGVCVGCGVTGLANIVDGSMDTAATADVLLSALGGGVFAQVNYGQPLPANSFTGLFISGEFDLLDLAVLGRFEIQARDGSTVVASASGEDLRVTYRPDGIAWVRFRSPAAFDNVRLRLASLASVDYEVNVHRALTVPVSADFAAEDDEAAYAGLDEAGGQAPPIAAAAPVASAEAVAVELGVPAPNPVAGSARIVVRVAEAGPVRVAAYDALGREVAVLYDGVLSTGERPLRFDGAGLAPGPYVVRASTAGGEAARTVTVSR
jgi:hypothetical protein